MKETKSVTTKTTTVPDAFRKTSTTENIIDRSDIVIPRLMTMQGLSKLVANEQAQMGDIVNSVTGEVLGGKDKPIRFVPLIHFKTVNYIRLEMGGKQRFVKSEQWNPTKHAGVEWNQTIDGVPHQVNECLNFYVMLEKDLEDEGAFPYLLSFQRMNYKNGKKLINHFMRTQMMKVEPWFGTLQLVSEKQTNDRGVFYIFDVRIGGQTEEKHATKLRTWAEMLAPHTHIIDEETDEAPSTAVPQTTNGKSSHQELGQF